jgi:prepilin-type N-terminal cleavage/methylation domain-containing protein
MVMNIPCRIISRRKAFSLLEMIIVLGILAIVVALLVPAILKARFVANRMLCANNLRQIGLAIHSYHDTYAVLPYARQCPAPWENGSDNNCENLPSPSTYTSTNEVWWAPYDNRPGTDPTHALLDYTPHSLLGPLSRITKRSFNALKVEILRRQARPLAKRFR